MALAIYTCFSQPFSSILRHTSLNFRCKIKGCTESKAAYFYNYVQSFMFF